jgi:hypothetical protein
LQNIISIGTIFPEIIGLIDSFDLKTPFFFNLCEFFRKMGFRGYCHSEKIQLGFYQFVTFLTNN